MKKTLKKLLKKSLLLSTSLMMCVGFASDDAVLRTASLDPIPGRAKTERSEKRLRINLDIAYTSLTYNSANLSGPGVGLGLQYAFRDKWGVVGYFAQGFTTSFGPVYSAIDIRGVYALTGTLISRDESFSIGSDEVLKSQEYSRGGLRLSVQTNIQFFSSINNVVPFTGFGLGMGYEFSSDDPSNYYMGVRMDALSSAKVTLSPIKLFFGILF